MTTLVLSILNGSSSFLHTSKPIISQMGSKFSRICPGTILNGSSSFLHTIRTTIKAWISLNFVKIPSPILELAPLEHLKN